MAVGNFLGGLTAGLGQGAALAGQLDENALRKKAAENVVDLGMIDPRLAGTQAPVAQVLPWFAAKASQPKTTINNMAMTPGRKRADMEAGKDYVDWSGGGFSMAQKGLDALGRAKADLAPGSDISGGFRGKVPDFIRTITNPKAVAVKENIRSAVMDTLRATLGAQFTEGEGERIFNLAYNDELPPEENIKKLEGTIADLTRRAEAKQSQADYFEDTGTLTGWQGRQKVNTGGGMKTRSGVAFQEEP
jgi:hypothetical protein